MNDVARQRAQMRVELKTKGFVSQRHTTSSRSPGYAGGSVRIELSGFVVCPKCGVTRKDLGGPHAPRFVGSRLVDCVGDEVSNGGKR